MSDGQAVYVTRHSSNKRVYHTDPHCQYAAKSDRELQRWPLETAEAWGLRQCKRCADEAQRGAAADQPQGTAIEPERGCESA